MTESFGPYCGDPLDRDLPPEQRGSCGRPFADVELRIVDVDDGTELPPGEPGEIQLRGPNLMRGICGRTPRRGLHRRRLLPHRRSRVPRRRRVPLLHRPARRHVQGQGRDGLPERGRGRAAREPRRAARDRGRSRRAPAPKRVGALVVLQPGRDVAADDLRRDAAARPRAPSRCRRVWAIVTVDEFR